MSKDDWLRLVTLLAPVVLMAVPKAAPIAPYVIAGITEAEQIKGASGPDKKTHALNVVEDGIKAINAVTASNKVLPAEGRAIAADVIDTVVMITNIVARSAANTTKGA
jgi:hypothetical protein